MFLGQRWSAEREVTTDRENLLECWDGTDNLAEKHSMVETSGQKWRFRSGASLAPPPAPDHEEVKRGQRSPVSPSPPRPHLTPR